MDLEYDRKFEEMKKYIPFLESMIKRLESTSSASANPRQAQLDKIRSLRDLLLDKKKRMKMENLLKCEQVLVNLYTKVEQRDTLPGLTLASNHVQTSKSKNKDNDLEIVRNKLKTVTALKVEDGQDTLPEIARASIIEELCTPGSKEPALFQRRPNKASISPGRSKSPNQSINVNASKRNYTRVLVSPEPSSKRWETSEKTSDKPLFSRRSPRRSPKRYSPTHTKKDRKKSSKQGQSKKANDLNITLNVPEESLNSLNSKDILSRIMNCSDNDVDIETLREAKRQILNELKHTGAKCDDISDLLLKSYKKNTGNSKKRDEVEEGELSDSESEAIQSIYGNFILDDDANSSKVKNSETQDKPRKIQICLVINSDKDHPSKDMKNDDTVVPCNTDTTDFEMYNKNSLINVKEINTKSEPVFSENNMSLVEKGEQNQKQTVNTTLAKNKAEKHENISSISQDVTKVDENKIKTVHDTISNETRQPANFYKPLKDEQKSSGTLTIENTLQTKAEEGTSDTAKALLKSSSITDNLPEIAAYLKDTENNEKATVEIPLLHEPSVATQNQKRDVVSEIDILQALKNEILSESLSIPGSETTPLLHQPKLTKVASAQEIAPKKRISIEKYKKKSAAASKATANSLFLNDPGFSSIDDSSSSWKEDNLKKQSLKLTEKECERFFSAKLDSNEDTDDDDYAGISDIEDTGTNDLSLNDIYENLAPKSPDHEPSTNKNLPPVIIPVDPVKATLAPSKADVDMRKLASMLSPNSRSPSTNNATKNDQNFLKSRIDNTRISSDPRMRRDINQVANIDSASVPTQLSSNRTPRSILPTPNMTPNMTPNRVMNVLPTMSPCMTPSMAANMTPNRNPNMTPRQTFGIDDNSSRKHVYAPTFQCDNNEQSFAIEQERKFYWEKSEKESEPRRRDGSRWEHLESRDVNPNRDLRSSSVQRETSDFSKSRFGEYYNHCDNFNPKYNERRDAYNRLDCPRTPLPSFGRQDGSTTPSHTYGRLDAPMTPIHPFGRSDCPPTPNQFSRADCPLTPSHPFGRPDCPQALIHPLGRNECPSTPSHPFERVEMPMTPSHPFGRSEPQSRDPRLNRSSDYDHYLNDETDRRISGLNNSYISETSSSETYREHRERTERFNYLEHSGRHYNKEKTFYRESSVGQPLSRDFKADRLLSRDRGYSRAGDEYYNKNDKNVDSRKGFYREHSMGRSIPPDGRSVCRTRDNTINTFVKSDAATSFTINTSVRSTFQNFLDSGRNSQVFNNNFDNRRKRAASVGRTLCRESSSSRSFHDTPKKTIIATNNINRIFRRARSVGRDILTSETERSFKDIKADFERYRLEHNMHNPRGFNKSIDNREPKQKDKSSDIKEPRRNDKPSDIKETRRNDKYFDINDSRINYKPFDVKDPKRTDKTFDVIEPKRNDKPFDIKEPKRKDKPFDVKEPKRTDKPFDIKESKKTDKPFDVKEPKRTDKLFDVKDSRKNDKPFMSNKSSNPISNRDVHQSGNTVLGKKPYSPRKNSRDPRFRRELHYSKNKYNIDNQRDNVKKNIGIVYSNDNITKGTILGTGYGVKNYKIPKIKRPIEDKEEKIVENKDDKMDEKKENKIDDKKENKIDEKKEDNKVEKIDENTEIIEEKIVKSKEDKTNDSIEVPKPQRVKKTSQGTKTKILNKLDEKIEPKTAENIVEKCEKRVTRLSKKNDSLLESADEDFSVITRRTKKPFVYDSDSESDQNKDLDYSEKQKNDSLLESADEDSIVITRRTKKPFVYDSDSESEQSKDLDYSEKQNTISKKTSNNIKEAKGSMTVKNTLKDQNVLDTDIECAKTTNKEINLNSKKVNDLETCFGIDDLEMFSDNITSDPVIDNINAIIANLDNDLEPSKLITSTELTDNIIQDNMLENINSGEDENVKAATENSNDLLKVNKKNSAKSKEIEETSSSSNIDIDSKLSASTSTSNDNIDTNIKKTEILELGNTKQINNKLISTDLKPDFTELTEPVNVYPTKSSISFDIVPSKLSDNMVSTTEENSSEIIEEKVLNNESISIPDSTNEVSSNNAALEESLPDSTNETQTDTNSIVTSSHDSLELVDKENAESSLANKNTTSINSIGNILSILQDKSKLKEILSLLSDKSSENEKIKKKLEKLSEIVSDDDDENYKSPCVPSVTSEKNPSITSVECHESKPANLNESDEFLNKSNDTDSATNETDKTNPTTGSDIILEEVNTKTVDDDLETQFDNDKSITETLEESEIKEAVAKENVVSKKMPPTNKKGRFIKKTKTVNKNISKEVRRITRSAILQNKVKKPSRELLKLQEDIKEMFISDDVLNATGIRMCRLAKFVDDNKSKEDTCSTEVMLEKFKDGSETAVETVEKKFRKKKGPKPKTRPEPIKIETKATKSKPLKFKPGPKSKTKLVNKSDDEDPYAFESDSVSENNFSTKSFDNKGSSDSENESIGSSQSFGSTDLLIELKKKPKRKRSNWSSGIIRPKNKKKKPEPKLPETHLIDDTVVPKKSINIPDINFTDKLYCFYKSIFTYSCRMCVYSGDDIVNHYKQEHPHSEIPLSRLSPDMAKEAIEQCEEINFQTISKLPSEKYICRFCFKEFAKKKAVLETFFWHVVSMHTGEYKQLCSLCPSSSNCPFNLDIPPPPKDVKGQLIGYICEKCNFTQISLENLKTHVIVRHNDEQTEVYTINLSATSRLAIINALSSQIKETEKPRMLRSTRANQSATKADDDQSEVTDSDPSNESLSPSKRKQPKKSTSPAIDNLSKHNIQSKITFENDDNASEASTSAEYFKNGIKVKIEKEEESPEKKRIEELKKNLISEICDAESLSKANDNNVPGDIFVYPHFKITYTNGGSKEYVCCINGQEHYNTSLLISFKKHVQLKHSEIWDGYCCLCKVIVTPQGRHTFKDCLQHYLDMHMDDFPVLETKESGEREQTNAPPSSNKNYINVRPISELMSKDGHEEPAVELPTLPKIESVVSLGAQTVEPPQVSPIYQPASPEPPVQEKEYKYEEVQAEVMSKKHRVVLDTMMSKAKLVNVFKCAGRYCSFSSDSVEEALLHASTHQRVGGESSLSCAYCDFDCAGNAIDLVMHVFKAHGACPYVCGYCFYRAAASQLIAAHITRMHSTLPQKILSAVNVPPPQPKDSSMLPREVVVRYYECPHACKFRTYTAGKYCEHLEQRHSGIPWQHCFLCTDSLPSAAQLVHHLKVHELNLYQCPWCLHGADSEPGLMFHASQKHPAKQPQAYLRVITNKDGSSEFRVLPLASFNKSKLSVEEVAPVSNKENPVREAERSIDLEKLIGHTNQMIESMAQAPEPAAPPTETETAVTSIINELDAPAKEPQISATILESTIQPQRPVTPPTTTAINEQVTPKIKIEPAESAITNMSEEIVCLDSDEEEPSAAPPCPQPVISLCDDDNASQTAEPSTGAPDERRYKIICTSKLYTCPHCAVLYKKQGSYRVHLSWCCSKLPSLQCPHCDVTVADRAALLLHFNDHSGEACGVSFCGECGEKFPNLPYTKRHMRCIHNITKYVFTTTKKQNEIVCVVTADLDHQPAEKYLNVCDVCQARFTSLAHVKRHLRYVHKVKKYTLTSRKNQEEQLECVVSEAPVKPASAKRKLSSSALGEPPAKLYRFGPTDIDRLPINPILDEFVTCSLCEFKTKVRLNMVRHLQQHGEQQPVPQTAPINPVPHLETNEKHFDKMLNLASSSIVSRAPDKAVKESPATQIPPEAAARYPRYVGERTRHTCGARGCSYISVDEAMLRCHWATLHAGTTDFHCVHCPPYQHLDTSKPLTPARIIAHLKMHDATLYACSACPYYHYKKQVVEKHLLEIHKNDGRVLVVREDVSAPTGSAQAAAAPTMDLKPWQCGLCSFKSMLRPEVVEHCAKLHQSKMQFRCYYCPFRTSALENVSKHQTNSHPGKKPEVCYYYYREGSIPDDDGGPRWMKQRQKFGTPENLEVKSEVDVPQPSMFLEQLLLAPQRPVLQPPVNVDINIVKKEVDDTGVDLTTDQLIRKYGEYCKPNGLKYKCPHCQVSEENREAMQSHLYEELSYRKWGCPMCLYKGFHKARLNEHFVSEHRGQNLEPIQQPTDINIEKWVFHLIETQNKIIVKAKESLPLQKAKETEKQLPLASTSKQVVTSAPLDKSADKFGTKQLEEAFGSLGEPANSLYCCPKCNFKVKEEAAMRDHLESELTKIRWCCSNCVNNFQTYHEAQFHCKSEHAGQAARPVEAPRDPALRNAWTAAVLSTQGRAIRAGHAEPARQPAHEPDNSLLVVRFEKVASVTTPPPAEPNQARPKRPAPHSDDDDHSDEPAGEVTGKCRHCNYRSRYNKCLREHEFRHYNLKPMRCNLCQYTGYRTSVMNHLAAAHCLPADAKYWRHSILPTGPPTVIDVYKKPTVTDDVKMKKNKREEDDDWRPGRPPGGKLGSREAREILDREKVKCNICKDVISVASLHEHHEDEHSTAAMNYTFLKPDPSRILVCEYCNACFKDLLDLTAHHSATHYTMMLKYTTASNISSTSLDSDDDYKPASAATPVVQHRMVARKSTSKLPAQAVAKKSTTKLPYDSRGDDVEYSYYGTKPTPMDQYEDVTTLMVFSNTMVPLTVKKFSELLQINPVVRVEDMKTSGQLPQ